MTTRGCAPAALQSHFYDSCVFLQVAALAGAPTARGKGPEAPETQLPLSAEPQQDTVLLTCVLELTFRRHHLGVRRARMPQGARTQ